jgi:RNA polymerase sigma-70 factor (ECF subfamily)
MSDPIEQLVNASKNGDLRAASELVTFFHEKIFSYLRRLCGNDQDAGDLSQKTFLKTWNSLSSYQGRSSFSTWLHGIAHHVYLDWRRQTVRSDHRDDDWWESCAADGPSPFENAADREMAHRLYAMVERLEEPNRQVVHLHYYQGLSLQETSEVLAIATSTVKYRLREALNVLRSIVPEPKH